MNEPQMEPEEEGGKGGETVEERRKGRAGGRVEKRRKSIFFFPQTEAGCSNGGLKEEAEVEEKEKRTCFFPPSDYLLQLLW